MLPAILKDSLSIPVIASPLFIISNPDLVIAQCKAGIVGSFPALNARPKEQLEEWIIKIKTALAEAKAADPTAKIAPFAVNQIVHASNDRLMHDMEVCVRQQVPIIITSLRPPGDVVKAVHSYGGIVLHDIISVRHAEKALEMGVDGLILVCAGAGGHAGALSPFALTTEIRKFYKGTIALSGAITSGDSVLACQAMGADLAYIGTRFIATTEARADQAYKEMITNSTANDIIYSSLFTGIHGNYLKGSVEKAGLDPANLPDADKSSMNFANVDNKPKAWKEIWGAGQGVGNIRDIRPAADVIATMKAEYEAAKRRIL
jgi:nitronate monooxygenase